MERDGNFQLLRMVFDLDPVDFSSIKKFISQPFRYSPVFCSFGSSSECNMFRKKNFWRLEVSIGQFTVTGFFPSPCHE